MSDIAPRDPFASIIAQAAKEEPDPFDAPPPPPGASAVILADVSASMSGGASGGTTKIEVLRRALASILPSVPGAVLVAFGATVEEVPSPNRLPSPFGGTDMAAALDHAARKRPRRTIVVSDGLPNDEDAALDSATRLTGVIEVVYCGPDDNEGAIRFMNHLARVGGGRFHQRDLRHAPELDSVLRTALALPAKGGAS